MRIARGQPRSILADDDRSYISNDLLKSISHHTITGSYASFLRWASSAVGIRSSRRMEEWTFEASELLRKAYL
jgi:hypothetical protein